MYCRRRLPGHTSNYKLRGQLLGTIRSNLTDNLHTKDACTVSTASARPEVGSQKGHLYMGLGQIGVVNTDSMHWT